MNDEKMNGRHGEIQDRELKTKIGGNGGHDEEEKRRC